jgi:hypothetical protein
MIYLFLSPFNKLTPPVDNLKIAANDNLTSQKHCFFLCSTEFLYFVHRALF